MSGIWGSLIFAGQLPMYGQPWLLSALDSIWVRLSSLLLFADRRYRRLAARDATVAANQRVA